MRAVVQAIIDELVAHHKLGEAVFPVDLNEVARVIGLRSVSYEEVERIVDALEAQGLCVGEDLSAVDVETLRRLMDAARGLRQGVGRPPHGAELGAKARVPQAAVGVMVASWRIVSDPAFGAITSS